jgi:Tfp pilus assembly protein PilW
MRLSLSIDELEPRLALSSTSPWAGYVISSSNVTAVKGSWTVPMLTGVPNEQMAMWVGIDGFSSKTLEQVGVLGYINPAGRLQYYAFYQMLPEPAVYIKMNGSYMHIGAGDEITASLSFNAAANAFDLSLTDNTTGQAAPIKPQAVPAGKTAGLSSAEWIVEDPINRATHRPVPFANFSAVSFYGASATINGTSGSIGNWQSQAINMTGTNAMLGTPLTMATASALTPAGTGFSVTDVTTGSATLQQAAGYLVETNLAQPAAGTIGSVRGTWTVPTVTGNTWGSEVSTWVGMSGGQTTKEEIGTAEYINSETGQPAYAAWFEMWPANPVEITTLTIQPGDSVTASVQYVTADKHFILTITDNTTGSSYHTNQTPPNGLNGAPTAAAWVVADPYYTTGAFLQLPTFTPIAFTDASVTISGKSGPINDLAWQTMALTMASGGSTEANVSPLDATGAGFTVTEAN